MKFTLGWLKEYVDCGAMSADELADRLTMLGLEVDSVTPVFQELSGLLTGTVQSCDKHPDADRLSVCQVKVGEQTHQIVCGAPNVRSGLNVVVALPGTVLPGDFKIKKSKIRGVASSGMLCSERELGLSSAHDGIMELPADTENGISFIKAMELEDICIEVDLTPNRADCAAVIGIAREVAAIRGKPLTLPVKGAEITGSSSQFAVQIENPELCPRYAARLVRGVKIAPSPWWLRKRLLAVGLRPVNNVVDITNFVMLEYGQPLHAFDFARLAGKKIVVRTPRPNETTCTTLDGASRTITADTLLICDGEKPVALAGIMGGKNSEITDTTTDILLESACFDPVSIRKSAKEMNISTDSSYRFERGVDPEGTINALARAVQLVCELAGGEAETGVDEFPGKKPPVSLEISTARTNTILGLQLKQEEIAHLLESIEVRCSTRDSDILAAQVPPFRIDLERGVDLIEEVARLYGYDNIPTTSPAGRLEFPYQESSRLKRLAIARELTTIGFFEAINYSFISKKELLQLELAASDPRRLPVALLNPLSEEQGVMRTTLLPGLLANVRRNINFQVTAIKLFELGKVFFPKEKGEPEEKTRLAGVLSGNRFGHPASPLYFKEQMVDIHDTRGAVEFIVQSMRLSTGNHSDAVSFRIPAEQQMEPFVQPKCALELLCGETRVGSLGMLKQEVLRNYSIKNDVFYFDLDYEALCGVKNKAKSFAPLPVYPAVRRDISLVVKKEIAGGTLLAAVKDHKDKLIEDAEIFDTFSGTEKIPQGCKSVSLRITYRSLTKTLTEKGVEKSHARVVRMLTDQFGGSFRNE